MALWIVVPSQSRTQMSLGDLDTVAYEVTVQLISPGVSSTYSRDMGQVPKQVTKQYRHVAPPPPFAPGRNREGKKEREREREARPPARPRARSQHPRTHNLLPPPRPHRIHAARKRDRSHFSPSSASPSRCRDPNTQLFLFFCFFCFSRFPPPPPLSFELSHARCCCCWCKTKSFLVRSLEIQNRIHFIWVPTCCCIGRQLLLLLLSSTYIPIKCFGSYQGLPFDNAVDLNFSLNFFWGWRTSSLRNPVSSSCL